MSAYIKTLKDYEGNTVYPQTVGSAVGIEEEMFGSAAGTSATEILKKLAGVDVENNKIIDYQGNELEISGDNFQEKFIIYGTTNYESVKFEGTFEKIDELKEKYEYDSFYEYLHTRFREVNIGYSFPEFYLVLKITESGSMVPQKANKYDRYQIFNLTNYTIVNLGSALRYSFTTFDEDLNKSVTIVCETLENEDTITPIEIILGDSSNDFIINFEMGIDDNYNPSISNADKTYEEIYTAIAEGKNIIGKFLGADMEFLTIFPDTENITFIKHVHYNIEEETMVHQSVMIQVTPEDTYILTMEDYDVSPIVYIDFEDSDREFEEELPDNIFEMSYVTTDFDLSTVPSLVANDKQIIARYKQGNTYLLNLTGFFDNPDALEIIFDGHINLGFEDGHLSLNLICSSQNGANEIGILKIINDELDESENFVIAENPEVVFPTEVVNADTLDGYEADDFAKAADLTALQTTIDGSITTKLEAVPTIHTSTSEPTASDGKNGDIWIVYEA